MSSLPESPVDGPERRDGQYWLSAAADGDADAVDRACKAWRDDASARATWHAYHLIGDVLRSSELAAQPSRDAAFLHHLRLKLAAEAVVLAPAPVAKRRASAWFMPTVAAAGFVVVAGVLVVSRVSAPPPADRIAASASPAAAQQLASGTAPTSLQVDAKLLRNPRLDEFLRAHQAARGGMAVAVPGSALRRADVEMPAGAQR